MGTRRAVYDPGVRAIADGEPEDKPEDQPEAGYDRIADGYARCWGPVIRPTAERVLDLVANAIETATAASRPAGRARLLDVGTGTGTLAIAALERWPGLEVTGVDPSGGMLELARAAARERLPHGHADRYTTELGWADELPFEDRAFDMAVSSFVLQLVPDRGAALREVHRVLRPAGTFAWVAWQRADRPYEPDRIANDVLDEAGFDPPEPDSRNGDVASPGAAAHAMRRAGFRAVRAHTDELVHAWDPASYLAFFTEFDEESLFAELEPRERRQIVGKIRRRLETLTRDQMTLRLPVVHAVGRAAG
jgi:SAM-dependent methyltransferase